MALTMKISLFSFMLIFMVFVSGCARLKWLDQKAGEIFFNSTASSSEAVKINQISGFSVAPPSAEDLSAEQKAKIEKWLSDNNLNRYGDAMDTYYAGGTPLFDEVTGKSIERFEYILKKHADIFEKIGE